jgi:uncharacterized protein YndB with AHSA1/START domain
MGTKEKTVIKVQTAINAPVDKVWTYWTLPEHIIKWNYASDDWHTPWAKNDLKPGGKLISRMEAKDGSMGFDFEGTYIDIKLNHLISYAIADGRVVRIFFSSEANYTIVTESFEAEDENSVEMQRAGWQAILNNFKKYVEKH